MTQDVMPPAALAFSEAGGAGDSAFHWPASGRLSDARLDVCTVSSLIVARGHVSDAAGPAPVIRGREKHSCAWGAF